MLLYCQLKFVFLIHHYLINLKLYFNHFNYFKIKPFRPKLFIKLITILSNFILLWLFILTIKTIKLGVFMLWDSYSSYLSNPFLIYLISFRVFLINFQIYLFNLINFQVFLINFQIYPINLLV